MTGAPLRVFFLTCEKVVFVELLTSVCGLCWRQRLVLLHTRVWRLWNGLWFENGPKYLKNTTVPLWTNSKEDLIWLLMLKEAILKNEAIGWFLCIFPIIQYIFYWNLCIFWIINRAKKESKDFLSSLYKHPTCTASHSLILWTQPWHYLASLNLQLCMTKKII